MLRCRFGVGVAVGWGMLASIPVKLNTLWMLRWTRCACYVIHSKIKFGLKHGSCNHAKGQFVRKFRRGRQKLLLAHTGAIDSVWRLVKQQVPGSLSSTVKGSKANPRLMVYARHWQSRFVKKKPFGGNRQKIVCWLLQMNAEKGKIKFIWHHATSRCANETTWKRGKHHMFQERANINQWIYEQDVDVISHAPAHTKCTWKPFLRSDNAPLRMFIDHVYEYLGFDDVHWCLPICMDCWF